MYDLHEASPVRLPAPNEPDGDHMVGQGHGVVAEPATTTSHRVT